MMKQWVVAVLVVVGGYSLLPSLHLTKVDYNERAFREYTAALPAIEVVFVVVERIKSS